MVREPTSSRGIDRRRGPRSGQSVRVDREDRVRRRPLGPPVVSERPRPRDLGFLARAQPSGLVRAARVRLGWPTRPLGTWPAAGGDLSWALPLRAHASTSGGLLVGRTAGRSITSAGLAGDHPLYRTGPLVFAAGLFLDAARIVAPADGSPEDRFYLDGGAGLRIGLADGQLGVLRIDVSRSLVADRNTALTLGVHRSWPLS